MTLEQLSLWLVKALRELRFPTGDEEEKSRVEIIVEFKKLAEQVSR